MTTRDRFRHCRRHRRAFSNNALPENALSGSQGTGLTRTSRKKVVGLWSIPALHPTVPDLLNITGGAVGRISAP